MSYGGAERGSYIGISGGKVLDTLALSSDVDTVETVAVCSSDMISENTSGGCKFSGV